MIVRRLLSLLLLLTLAAWNLAPLSVLTVCFAMHSRAAALDQTQPPAEQRSARDSNHEHDCCLPLHEEQRDANAIPSQLKVCAVPQGDCCIARDPQGLPLTSSVQTVVPPREVAPRPVFVNPTGSSAVLSQASFAIPGTEMVSRTTVLRI